MTDAAKKAYLLLASIASKQRTRSSLNEEHGAIRDGSTAISRCDHANSQRLPRARADERKRRACADRIAKIASLSVIRQAPALLFGCRQLLRIAIAMKEPESRAAAVAPAAEPGSVASAAV